MSGFINGGAHVKGGEWLIRVMKKLFENELHLLVSNLALKYWNYWITGKNLPYRTLNYSNFDVNTYQATKKNMKSWSLQCLVGHTTKAPSNFACTFEHRTMSQTTHCSQVILMQLLSWNDVTNTDHTHLAGSFTW